MKSLKSIVCKALDDQEVQGSIKVNVAKVSSDAYTIQIIVEDHYVDDVDEMDIYDRIADTDYCDFDINIDIMSVEDEQDKFEYTSELSNAYEADENPEDAKKSDEELAAEADDLHVFDVEDFEEDALMFDDDEDDDFDARALMFGDIDDDDDTSDYSVTWSDVEDFEKEFGDE